jgi:AraC-like DNA-binding protein
MTTTVASDRLRTFVDVLVESVGDPADGEELARRVHLSRFHFDRLVSAALGEAPAAFRRRLLLERAAYELATSERTVTRIAVDAGYGSLEAFTRAFGRAYRLSPSRFRERGSMEFRVPAPNGVHFHPPGGVLVPGDDQRRKPMDLAERMVEQDNALTQRLLQTAARLSDDELDESVPLQPRTDAFFEDAPSIRSMLDRLVVTKEVWTASIAGRRFDRSDDRSLDGMRERFARAGEEFVRLVQDIRGRDAWDTAFVDTTCEPPETFTYGAAVAHALTWDAYRRKILEGAFRARGVEPAPAAPGALGRPSQA